MSEHPHIEIGRRLWRATSLADTDTIRHLLSPDIIWRNRASGVFSGCIHGPEGVIDMLARAGELVDSLTSKLIDIYANDRGFILHYQLQAEHESSSLDTQILLMMKVHEGRVIEANTIPIDASPLDQFWALH